MRTSLQLLAKVRLLRISRAVHRCLLSAAGALKATINGWASRNGHLGRTYTRVYTCEQTLEIEKAILEKNMVTTSLAGRRRAHGKGEQGEERRANTPRVMDLISSYYLYGSKPSLKLTSRSLRRQVNVFIHAFM